MNLRSRFAVYFLLGFSFLALALTSRAQDQATIVGTVTDTSGGVVPSASVTVSNPEKGFNRELTANAAGEYTAAKIPIGNYTISAGAPGFQKLIRTGITVTVGQTLRMDLRLDVGRSTQEVTVTGNVPRVETETGAISNVVTGSQVVDLELNGRSFAGLYLLVPGAMPNNGLNLQTGPWYTPISFNGGRWQFSNVEINGATNNDEGAGGSSLNTLPSIDAIAEFRISTSNYGADLGKHGGTSVEIATKSGTRQFHGSAYEFLRNDHLDANDWFRNRQINPPGGHAPKTPLKWNDFGYNLGGPFYIPGHYNTDKSKTFFFWSNEFRRYRQGNVIDQTVPSLRMRQGDFSECDPASPNFDSEVAPGCVLPTVNGIPTDTVPIDPNAKAMLDALVPLPNSGPVGYVAAPNQPTNWQQQLIRVDHNLSPRTSLFVHFIHDGWLLNRIPPERSNNIYDTSESSRLRLSFNTALHLTHSFKPNLLNEVIVSYTDNELRFQRPIIGPSNAARSLNKPSTWSAVSMFAANASNPLIPGIYVNGGLPFGAEMSADATDYPNGSNSTPTYDLKDNVVYAVGKHTLKFGFFLERFQKNELSGLYLAFTQGIYSFSDSSPISTGNALADMYLGRIASYSEGTQTANGVPVGGYPKGYWRSTDFEPYFQDDWKVTPKFTLNLGLRYYYATPAHDVRKPQTVDSVFLPSPYSAGAEALLDTNGNLAPDPATGHVHTYLTFGNGLAECGTGGVPTGCTRISRKNFAPRIGFAFDPTGSGKTAIRGGYGIFFDAGGMGAGSTALGMEGNPPVALFPSAFNIIGFQNLIPFAPGTVPPGYVITIPSEVKLPSLQQFSLSAEHEFAGNNLLSVGYVGSLGRHLNRGRNLSQVPVGVGTQQVLVKDPTTGQVIPLPDTACDSSGNCDVQDILTHNRWPTIFFSPFPGYSEIDMSENTAVSSYNSLQVNYRHPFGHGLMLQAAYAWSHNIDDASSAGQIFYVDSSNLSRWRATSTLDRTQSLVLNYIYELPFLKHSSNSFLKNALGGWKVSGITSFLTGQPVSFGCSIRGRSSGIGNGIQCNSVGPAKIEKGTVSDPSNGPTPTWFDPSFVGQPSLDQLAANGQPGMFGYMGRNNLAGPGRNNWDLALLKEFSIPWFGGEHSTLQFRWETFNTFNHPQWRSVRTGCNSGTPPGTPCVGSANIRMGEVSAAWDPRIMQFALKFIF